MVPVGGLKKALPTLLGFFALLAVVSFVLLGLVVKSDAERRDASKDGASSITHDATSSADAKTINKGVASQSPSNSEKETKPESKGIKFEKQSYYLSPSKVAENVLPEYEDSEKWKIVSLERLGIKDSSWAAVIKATDMSTILLLVAIKKPVSVSGNKKAVSEMTQLTTTTINVAQQKNRIQGYEAR